MKRAAVPSPHRWAGLICVLTCCGLGLLLSAQGAAAASACRGGSATTARVGRPTARIAWRAELFGPTAVYAGIPDAGRRTGWVEPRQASWLLVLDAAHDGDGRCWIEVRLPTRPNDASGWVRADQVLLGSTPWSITISPATRTLTLFRRNSVAMRVSVVVGRPSTPTPTGLFSIIGAWPSSPNAFLGSWILPLTAHSDALQSYDGGDGTVGIHGRGGTSLLDPLGSAASHGCIRLDNHAIDRLVQLVGASGLAGIPVRVS